MWHEVLKDADGVHHCMNDMLKTVKDKEKARFESLCAEFGMGFPIRNRSNNGGYRNLGNNSCRLTYHSELYKLLGDGKFRY